MPRGNELYGLCCLDSYSRRSCDNVYLYIIPNRKVYKICCGCGNNDDDGDDDDDDNNNNNNNDDDDDDKDKDNSTRLPEVYEVHDTRPRPVV